MLWKTIRRPLFCLVTLVSMFFLCKGTSIAGPDNSQELFSNPSGLNYLDVKATEKRTSLVNVNLSMLYDAKGKALDAKQLPSITLNLFSDAVFTGVVKNVVQDQFGTTWAGQLDGYQGGYFAVTVVEGVLMAHVASPTGIYEVSTAGNGSYKVIEIDQSKFKDCPEGAKYDPPGKILPAGDLGILADSAARIDVMVVYTTAARVAEGSVSAMKARIKSGIDLSNLAYAYSSVYPRLRLVHVEEVAYTESGNITTDVNRLTAQTDGYMDIVHALRNIYGADMVSLLVNNGGGYCGMAKAIMANQSTAFQVTARDCITGNYSLQHEFGHLQGLRHDRYVDPATTPYAFGHGYVHPYSTDTGDR
ncbi:MAG: zinc-dependent metalloprotease family protein, partial [Desulfocapsaceae bacterium]|nr:zinc-dependent metalloprotease family protein [Desulfocapsaceae bacterium]